MVNYGNYDVLVIGAGFAGAVVARELAETGKKVLIIEKRNHIAGNMYETSRDNGVRVHLYGPHIFHTNYKVVYDYLRRFDEFFPYEHRVLGLIDGKLVPIPFNFKSIDTLFEKSTAIRIKELLLKNYPNETTISILDLIKQGNEDLNKFGQYVFEKVFVHYTAKQWGCAISEVDTSVINRVPVVLGYDDRYFHDRYQFMPKHGFTFLFERLLDNNNITTMLNKNIVDDIKIDEANGSVSFGKCNFEGECIYTGPVDELLGFQYGELPYRSLKLVFEDYNQDCFQSNSVVNYPNNELFTRITEFKYLTKQQISDVTSILKEYPIQYNDSISKCFDPFYPIISSENNQMYKKYQTIINRIHNFSLIGRLAEYKYYNMDVVIKNALDLSEEIRKKRGWVNAE